MSSAPAPARLIIGLTGNIATGKSTVMRLAAERGALTIDADQVVHDILDNDASMQAAIAAAFGDEVRRPDGRIDRRRLGAIVFNDAEALRDLELLLHPLVRQRILAAIEEAEQRAIMIEAIRLLEGGLAAICHQIWVTRCPRQHQLDRLVICRGLDAATAAQRVDAQPPQEAKVAQADVVIDTDGTMAATETQFRRAWERLPLPEPALTPATAPAGVTVASEEESIPLPEPAANVTVRRARPADVPAVLLHIRRATKGVVQLKRGDLLLELSERSYLIGQTGTQIGAVLGWSADNMLARIERIYFQPPEMALSIGPAVLDEIEKSADELLCEAILAFPPLVASPQMGRLFSGRGYRVVTDPVQLPRVWQTAVAESRPPDSLLLVKVLRDRRIA